MNEHLHYHLKTPQYGNAEYHMEGHGGYCDGVVFKCANEYCNEQLLPGGEIIVMPRSVAESMMNEMVRKADQVATVSHELGYNKGYKEGFEDGAEDASEGAD